MADLTNTMICWDYEGKVGLVPYPDERNLSYEYEMSHGACWAYVHKLDVECAPEHFETACRRIRGVVDED